MLILEATFLAGRYHATPWGRHVNEGSSEWPPSPWRLLRALVSSWKRTAPDQPQAEIAELLTKLAAELPSFHLPATTAAHTRHYVPTDLGQRLLIDAFTQVDQPVTFLWPQLTLEPAQDQLLDRLLQGISYLGRAESWCQLTRRQQAPSPNAWPLEETEEASWDLVTLLCPEPQVTVDQLCQTTEALRRQGYNRPPGTRWAGYRFSPPQLLRPPAPTMALYLFAKQERPRRGETLSVADRFRRHLLQMAPNSPTLTGRGPSGEPRLGHRHLHILPQGPASARHLHRLLLWAPEGFSPADREILSQLDLLPTEKKKWQMPLRFKGVGGAELGGGSGPARSWLSSTPYLLTRHPRSRGRDSAQQQIRRECALRGLPQPQVVEMPGDGLEYQVHRGPRLGPPGPPHWFQLTFPQPVEGPLCLGASSHFGMGCFEVRRSNFAPASSDVRPH